MIIGYNDYKTTGKRAEKTKFILFAEQLLGTGMRISFHRVPNTQRKTSFHTVAKVEVCRLPHSD